MIINDSFVSRLFLFSSIPCFLGFMLTTTARIDEDRLSGGSVRAMFEGKQVHGPWLQFLQIKVYEKPNGGGVHYKYTFSMDVSDVELLFLTANTLFRER